MTHGLESNAVPKGKTFLFSHHTRATVYVIYIQNVVF